MIRRFVERDKKRPLGKQRMFDIIRAPLLTEKSTRCSENSQYVFEVLLDANKIEIKQAVEKLFSVSVKAVNTVRTKGKVKRFRGRLGYRSDMKKAIVTLQSGQAIDLTSGQVL